MAISPGTTAASVPSLRAASVDELIERSGRDDDLGAADRALHEIRRGPLAESHPCHDRLLSRLPRIPRHDRR